MAGAAKRLCQPGEKEFLTGLGEDPEYLRSKGFSETEIRMIQDGKSPDGW